MKNVRARDTKPELIVRKGLHAAGFRYRLHGRDLPGSPDLILPRYRTVIFVHGCFWHGHDCSLFKIPETRRDFWQNKVALNRARDQRAHEALLQLGWRVVVIWECSLKGRERLGLDEIVGLCRIFLLSQSQQSLEVRGGK
ncbi:very short patch repair endonuclease [Stenotrophomonas sp. ZAC14A_NAIMI4_1]|nr:very short patch repair endonuclease [Stenotrophomonas sp. ZAC14A_NAIMI4_1]